MDTLTREVMAGATLFEIPSTGRSNSLTSSSMDAIIAKMEELDNDGDVRAVILTGQDDVFCSGADIDALQQAIQSGNVAEHVRSLTDRLHPMLLRMRTSSTVYVAAINGSVAGGGLGLALGCDLRIAVPKARLASAYFTIGLCPDGGSSWLLPRLIGESATRRFLFEEMVYTASEALDAGLVDEVVPPTELIDRAAELAASWSSHPPHLIKSTKILLQSSSEQDMKTQLLEEQERIIESSTHPYFAERVQSFLDRRRS